MRGRESVAVVRDHVREEGPVERSPLVLNRKLSPRAPRRKVVTRPGRAEELVERLGLPWRSLGRGRGGERLGMLVAITGWLVDAARKSSGAAPAVDR